MILQALLAVCRPKRRKQLAVVWNIEVVWKTGKQHPIYPRYRLVNWCQTPTFLDSLDTELVSHMLTG